MVEVTANLNEMDNIVVDKSLLGSKVLAKNGENIGFLDAIFLDPKELCIKAIQINKGLLKYNHYIGRKYIEQLGPKGVILKILPLEDLIGKKVFDASVKEIGKVVDIKKVEGANKLISISVSSGIGKDNIIILTGDIKEIGESILLNVDI